MATYTRTIVEMRSILEDLRESGRVISEPMRKQADKRLCYCIRLDEQAQKRIAGKVQS